MRIIEAKTYEEMSRIAANLISAQIIMKPDCVLGLATGSTPVKTYEFLRERYHKENLDFSGITTVNLDEYVGLDAANDQSYRYFMNEKLFAHVNIRQEATYVPDGKAEDIALEGKRYDDLIASLGGIDLQLLGIGHNGHIGFNEPCDVFVKETHLVDLGESTIQANARFFRSEADVPKQAVTMGIGAIMLARRVLLVANGKDKKDIIEKAFFGSITPQVPASVLQLHPNLTVVCCLV